MVKSMWTLLGELSVMYCQAASWALAAGETERATMLIEKAHTCLVQRARHQQPEDIVLSDVLREP
jgi:hypothetical protein